MESPQVKRAALILVATLVLVLVLSTRSVSSTKTSATTANKIRDDFGPYVRRAADLFNLPATRIQAIVAVESAGDRRAIGPAGEVGLMQVTPIAFADVVDFIGRHGGWSAWGLPALSYGDLEDPASNILAGSLYLAILRDRCGDLDTATRGYNVGLSKAIGNGTAGAGYLAKVRAWESSQFNN